MSDKLLTLKEVTEILRCSRYFVIRLAKDGILPCVAFGGKYRRYRQSDVDRFLEQGVAIVQQKGQALSQKESAGVIPHKNPPDETASGRGFELKGDKGEG